MELFFEFSDVVILLCAYDKVAEGSLDTFLSGRSVITNKSGLLTNVETDAHTYWCLDTIADSTLVHTPERFWLWNLHRSGCEQPICTAL